MIDQIVQDILSFGWSYQQNVVDKLTLKSLAPLFETEFLPAQVGSSLQRQRNVEIRGDLTKWLDPHDPPREIHELVELLHRLKQEFNQRFYLGLKDVEFHLAKYPAGSFYKKHSDRFESDSSRSVTFIFYLHQEWNESLGGELVLYNKKNEILKEILPDPGSMVIFMSEDFPHEVRICSAERRSFTGWIHTKILT
jgi:SM-20-related protein